jgi:replicative DNA helicase
MKSSKSNSKWEGLVETTNELKAVALATDSTIIMVSQDQRGSADEGSTESNMGGSVSVYQAADIYIGMMQNDEMREQKKLNMRLIKNRNGAPGESDIMCDPEHMRFGEWAQSINHFDKGTMV